MSRTVATISVDSSPSSSSSSVESSFRVLDDVFLQSQTKIWLGEVLRTRFDEQLTISDLLADGELLEKSAWSKDFNFAFCDLANSITDQFAKNPPKSFRCVLGITRFGVSKILWTMLLAKCKELRNVKDHIYNPTGSKKCSGRYRPYSNVDSFLKICKILGLSGIDLFSPSDVVEKRDTRKVCICVRSLSKKARSKQLNVPDFDVVTYTVAMPTNMVGCLRRSLELSKCSFKDSSKYTPCRDSKLKLRQKKSATTCDRNYDSYSEASDDMESYSTEVPFYSLSTIYSYDTASLKDSNLENSPEVSSVVKKLTSLSVSRTDIQVEGKQEYFLDEDTAEGYYIPHQLEFPDLIALRSDNNPIFFDGEDSMFNLLLSITDSLGANSTGTSQNEYRRLSDDFEDVEVSSATSMSSVLGITDSLGSNSTRTSQNGCRRRLSDDFEDVEVSSVTSMSSVLGRVLNLDFDDQFDAADDLKTAKIDITGLQNCEVDNIYEIQLAEYEKCLQGLVSESERSHYEAKLRNSGFSTKLSLPCSDSSQSQDVGSFNTEFVCQINSREELCFKGKKFTVSGNAKELNGEATGELDTRTSYMVSVDNPTVDHNFPNSTNKCQFTAINHISSTRQPLANDETKHEINARLSPGKPHGKPLLKTIVKATALFGMLFLLLHLRRSGRQNRGKVSENPIQIQKPNGIECSSMQGQKGGRTNGIYPAEKFKFDN